MTPDLEPPPPEEEYSATVVPLHEGRLRLDGIGPDIDSMRQLLENDERRRLITDSDEPLRFNEMTMGIEQGDKPVELRSFVTRVRCLCQQRISFLTQKTTKDCQPIYAILKPKKDDVADAVVMVARKQSFNPVKQYLESVRGTPDAEGSIGEVARAMGITADLDLAMLRRWAISAVARAMEPGCKVDTVLVLVGEQGVGKSSFFGALGGDFFSDTAMDMRNKDRFLQLHAAWLYEWSELSSIRAADMEEVKAFITSREDNFRAPYDASTAFHKRGGIIVGSTNRVDFLRDPSGNRRFWVVVVQQIDVAAVRALRHAFWAEALALYEAGVAWWFEDEHADMAIRHAEHREEDAWEPVVEKWAKGYTQPKTVKAALTDKTCIGLEIKDAGKVDQMRMAGVFRAIGLARLGRQMVDGVREVVWQWA